MSVIAVQEFVPPLPIADGVEYRHIPGFAGYAVGTDGSLWSVMVPNKKRRVYASTWFRKRCWKNQDGYLLCSLRGEDGKEHRPLVHTLILTAFVGPRPRGLDTLHRNGVPDDNRLENLKWGTRKENMEDARRHGTLTHRERNGHAKLNNLKALAVKTLSRNGWTQRDIAAILGVTQPTISAVLNGHRWEQEHENSNENQEPREMDGET